MGDFLCVKAKYISFLFKKKHVFPNIALLWRGAGLFWQFLDGLVILFSDLKQASQTFGRFRMSSRRNVFMLNLWSSRLIVFVQVCIFPDIVVFHSVLLWVQLFHVMAHFRNLCSQAKTLDWIQYIISQIFHRQMYLVQVYCGFYKGVKCFTTYTVYCTVFIVCCTMYVVYSTLYNLRSTLYILQYTLYTVQGILQAVYCIIYTLHSTLHIIHCILHNAQCTIYYNIYCTLYKIYCTLYTV